MGELLSLEGVSKKIKRTLKAHAAIKRLKATRDTRTWRYAKSNLFTDRGALKNFKSVIPNTQRNSPERELTKSGRLHLLGAELSPASWTLDLQIEGDNKTERGRKAVKMLQSRSIADAKVSNQSSARFQPSKKSLAHPALSNQSLSSYEMRCIGPKSCGYRGSSKEFQTGHTQSPFEWSRCEKRQSIQIYQIAAAKTSQEKRWTPRIFCAVNSSCITLLMKVWRVTNLGDG